MNHSVLDVSSYLELSLQEAGRETCIADKHIRFTPKEYPVIHYVYSGQGQFTYGGKTYLLKPGDCFFIPGGEEAIYRPYSENPWSYFWIGLDGTKANTLIARAGFSKNNPILHDKRKKWKAKFEAIHEDYYVKGRFEIEALGHAYLLLAEMVADNRDVDINAASERGHIQAAKAYINNNFQFPITILDVARSVSVSPNYLANLFAKQGEVSPKRYLTVVRMEAASRLLLTSSSNITDVSKAVGYSSPLHFSKVFTNYYGISPLHYRLQGGNKK